MQVDNIKTLNSANMWTKLEFSGPAKYLLADGDRLDQLLYIPEVETHISQAVQLHLTLFILIVDIEQATFMSSIPVTK